MPGVLFVREDHGIGSYDAFLVPPVSVNYKRKSGRMTEDLEEELKTMLRDSLLQGMTRSEIPVENAPGQCVMQVSLALYNVQVAKRNSAETLGTMTLVMEFRDSTSGQPLLRYAVPNKIERKGSGNRTRQLRQGFDRMVDQLNVGQAMRAAGLDDGEVRPGCTGAMAKATEAGLPAVSGQ